jgi:hypothetical protein
MPVLSSALIAERRGLSVMRDIQRSTDPLRKQAVD